MKGVKLLHSTVWTVTSEVQALCYKWICSGMSFILLWFFGLQHRIKFINSTRPVLPAPSWTVFGGKVVSGNLLRKLFSAPRVGLPPVKQINKVPVRSFKVHQLSSRTRLGCVCGLLWILIIFSLHVPSYSVMASGLTSVVSPDPSSHGLSGNKEETLTLNPSSLWNLLLHSFVQQRHILEGAWTIGRGSLVMLQTLPLVSTLDSS